MMEQRKAIVNALWQIYQRPERPSPWQNGGNLPWNDPVFSTRMLREHLDESHGAASRQAHERRLQLAWIWEQLDLKPGDHLLDVTCGPGLYAVPLAQQGLVVTGIDFSPAAIAHARAIAHAGGVNERVRFIEQDIRSVDFSTLAADGPATGNFGAALMLYGQLAVFPQDTAATILAAIAHVLPVGGKLVVELLDQDRVDKKNSNWWFTDDDGLWGDAPFLHLGERFWDDEARLATERYQILHLDSGHLDEIILSDQTYSSSEMAQMLRAAGFSSVSIYPGWAGLPLYDAQEWVVYVASR